MNTLKNLMEVKILSTQNANCIKGGVTDPRRPTAQKPATYGGFILVKK